MSIVIRAVAAGVREYNAQMRAANGEHDHEFVETTDFGDGDTVVELCVVTGCGLERRTRRGQRL